MKKELEITERLISWCDKRIEESKLELGEYHLMREKLMADRDRIVDEAMKGVA